MLMGISLGNHRGHRLLGHENFINNGVSFNNCQTLGPLIMPEDVAAKRQILGKSFFRRGRMVCSQVHFASSLAHDCALERQDGCSERGFRGIIFLVAVSRSHHFGRSEAVFIEVFYGAVTGGVFGTLAQSLRSAQPAWIAESLLFLVIPVLFRGSSSRRTRFLGPHTFDLDCLLLLP